MNSKDRDIDVNMSYVHRGKTTTLLADGLEHVFSHILGTIIPTDSYFSEGFSTTKQIKTNSEIAVVSP